MTFLAIFLAFVSGALGMYSLVVWQQSIHDWRQDAWTAAAGMTGALILGWFA